MAEDLNTEILKSIRDELRDTRLELRDTREDLGRRISETNVRLDRLEKRQTQTEIRLATELTEVAKLIGSLRDAILEDRQLRARVDDHEARIRSLETA